MQTDKDGFRVNPSLWLFTASREAHHQASLRGAALR